MTRTPGIVALAAIIALAAPAASRGENNVGAPLHANAETARSPGHALNRESPSTAGLGSGDAATGPAASGDAAIKAENDFLNRKLKSICRGC